MRSTIGLLAVLLLLPSCSTTVTHFRKDVIACGNVVKGEQNGTASLETIPHPLVFFWSTEDSELVMDVLLDSECSIDAITRTCMETFEDFSYGVELNETRDLAVVGTNLTAETRLFKCEDLQDGFLGRLLAIVGAFIFRVKVSSWDNGDFWKNLSHRRTIQALWGTVPQRHFNIPEIPISNYEYYTGPEEPLVPEGFWSDRLFALPQYDANLTCKSEAQWLMASIKECGAKPTQMVLGWQCEGEKKYLDVVFVCDQPRRNFSKLHDLMEKKDAKFLLAQAELLKIFAKSVERLQEARTKNIFAKSVERLQEARTSNVTREEALKEYEKDILRDYKACQLFYLELFVASETEFNQHGKSYLSREVTFEHAKGEITGLAGFRSIELISRAAHLLTNTTVSSSNLESLDVEKIKLLMVDRSLGLFPEFKERLTDYYLDYIKNHTFGIARKHLGFLNETGAHARLASMYEKMFSLGSIDLTYSDEDPVVKKDPCEKP
uniref:CHAT domain-containing protein n=1 Tax=Steinernema glaseri TaxID=37863 RepID=A0A1I7ZPP1_9BILA